MSTYFVSTAGSDSAGGSSANPWKTLQHAASMVQAGDTVDVRAGTYAGFVLGWDGPQNGTASAPITFKAESGVVINATNNKTRDGINVEDCSYIVIDGFTIQHSSGAEWRSGIRFGGGGTGNVARNNIVIMKAGDDMGIFSSFNTNQVVENNEVSGNDDAGIYCSNSAVNPTVRNNYVHDLSPSTGQAVGIHFNGDVSMGGNGIINGGLVEGNKVYNCGTGISMDGMQNATVRNNLVLEIHGKGINLYQADASAGSKNDVVVNNTVVLASDGYFPIGVRDGSTNVKVLNNIGIGGSRAFVTDSSSKGSLVVDYNIWSVNAFSNDNDSGWMKFPNWQATGQDGHTILSSASALFVNASSDYHLLSTAPAVDAGTSTSAPTTDDDGNARPAGSGYDIGAFEYGSSGSGATAPADPSGLSATAYAYDKITVVWTDNSNDESGFMVYRRTGASGSYVQMAMVGAGVTSWDDTSVAGDTTYYYRACAYNSAGNSGYSNIDSALTPAQPTAPAAPGSQTATASGAGEIDLTWADQSNNESHFQIQRKLSGGSYSVIVTLGSDVTSYSDTTGLAAGSTYVYRVRATNSVGNSSWSGTASATTDALPTAPDAPGNLAATGDSWSTITLSWTDNSNNETGFKIERMDGTGSFVQIGTVGANVKTYQDTGLDAQTQYIYRLRATNGVGDSGYTANASGTTQAVPTAPGAPDGLAASAVNSTQINLSWSDHSGNETGFKVERSTDGNAWTPIATVGANVTSYQSKSLAASTTYYYRVRATNGVGDSAYTDVASATTAAAPADTLAPSASASFSDITAAGDGTYSFTVTYSDDTAVDETSLDSNDILVSGSNGYSQAATFVSSTSSNGGATVTARYRITAPGSTWSWTDDGSYTFVLQAGQVGDTAGNKAAAVTLGTTSVNVPSVDYAGSSRNTARNLGHFKMGRVRRPVDTVTASDDIQDYYQIYLPSAQTVSVKLFELTEDASLQLRAVDNTLICASGRSGTSDEYIGRTLQPGTYYLRVINDGPEGTNYVMRVAVDAPAVSAAVLAGPDYAGINRSHARRAHTMTGDRVAVYTDLVSPADVNDFYRFEVSDTIDFYAKLTELSDDVNMQLQDANGQVIRISAHTGSGSEFIHQQLTAGTYYIRLYSLGNTGTNYRLRLAA